MFCNLFNLAKKWLACTFVVTMLSVPTSPILAQDAATRGKQLARLQCARCHVLPSLRNMGIGSTPSFKIMVQSKAADWRDKFEAFFSLPPHPAFVTIKELRTERSGPPIVAPILMSLRDLDDLMAFIDELAEEFREK